MPSFHFPPCQVGRTITSPVPIVFKFKTAVPPAMAHKPTSTQLQLLWGNNESMVNCVFSCFSLNFTNAVHSSTHLWDGEKFILSLVLRMIFPDLSQALRTQSQDGRRNSSNFLGDSPQFVQVDSIPVRNTNSRVYEVSSNNRLIASMLVFYPMILIFMTNNTLRQHNTKQYQKVSQSWMDTVLSLVRDNPNQESQYPKN